MPIPIRFDKSRAVQVLESLPGNSIAPAGELWSVNDALLVAGALLSNACEALPIVRDGERLHAEHLENREAVRVEEVMAALRWYADRARQVRDGTYDANFEPVHEAIIKSANGRDLMIAISGFKQPR